MNAFGRLGLSTVLFAAAAVCGSAQEMNPTATPPPPEPSPTNPQGPTEYRDGVPVYKIQVVARDIPAINYFHRQGATKIGFEGTSLLPAAKGEAKVEATPGRTTINLHLEGLSPANGFGAEYLTYVLWAISPEGRAVNLGEVLVGDNHRSKLRVTTDLQAFALIVTAEPYYAVRQPSNVVVLENVVRDTTKGTTEAVNAKYELMERGGYIPTGYKFDPVILNARLPLEFFEARNALRIAQSEGAEQYASDSYQHAVQLMNNADEYATSKHIDTKPLIAVSREAVQTSEDAREIAVKKLDEIRLANERRDSANTLAVSQGQADSAMRQKEQAESDAARAEAAKTQAESDAHSAQSAKAQAESDAAAARTSAAIWRP